MLLACLTKKHLAIILAYFPRNKKKRIFKQKSKKLSGVVIPRHHFEPVPKRLASLPYKCHHSRGIVYSHFSL